MLKICVILIVSVIHVEPLLLVREKERKKYFRFSADLKFELFSPNAGKE